MLRWGFWISNNDWDTGFLLFSSVAEARAHIDVKFTDLLALPNHGDEEEWDEGEWGEGEEDSGEDEGEDDDAGAKQTFLQIHRPGQRIAEYDLNARTRTGPGGERIEHRLVGHCGGRAVGVATSAGAPAPDRRPSVFLRWADVAPGTAIELR